MTPLCPRCPKVGRSGRFQNLKKPGYGYCAICVRDYQRDRARRQKVLLEKAEAIRKYDADVAMWAEFNLPPQLPDPDPTGEWRGVLGHFGEGPVEL
jgi:hypothetical protein